MKTVSQESPRRHCKHLVRRGEATFIATPCYGMHEPWWVPTSGPGTESEPIAMEPGDLHQPLEELESLRRERDEALATVSDHHPAADWWFDLRQRMGGRVYLLAIMDEIEGKMP